MIVWVTAWTETIHTEEGSRDITDIFDAKGGAIDKYSCILLNDYVDFAALWSDARMIGDTTSKLRLEPSCVPDLDEIIYIYTHMNKSAWEQKNIHGIPSSLCSWESFTNRDLVNQHRG